MLPFHVTPCKPFASFVMARNGAGKTTFVKLLCRLYEPTEGAITLNGIDIRKYREEEYRELFGVVLGESPYGNGSRQHFQRHEEIAEYSENAIDQCGFHRTCDFIMT